MYKKEYQNIFESKDAHWWYLGMGEIATLLLEQYLLKKRGLKILDAGCGPGAAFSYLKKFGQVTGVDISDDALKYARKTGIRVVKGNVIKLPFKANSFDLLVCFDVLYHLWVKDYRLAIGEFHRVLKPGGILLIREPAFEWLKSSHDVVDMAKRRFRKRELKTSLERNSFKILKLTYANFFLFPFVLLKRLPEALGLKKKRIKSDIQKTPVLLNSLFYQTLKLEARLIKLFNFPFGSSLICLAQFGEP